MSKISVLFVAFVSIFLILSASVHPIFAYPFLSGSIEGPDSVTVGKSFDLRINVQNSGNTPVYCVAVEITAPSGFKPSKTNLYFSVIGSGGSKSQTLRVSAPKYPTSGTFSGSVKYSDNIKCKGTSLFTYLNGLTVNVKELGGNLVTFILSSVRVVTSGGVTIYDSKGNFVTTGAGKSECSSCPTKVQIYLPPGKYNAAAWGQLDGCRQLGFCNAIGKKDFTVKGNTLVDIWLIPMP